MSFLWGPFVGNIIDDFEDNDLKEYSITETTNNESVSITSDSKIGDKALKLHVEGGTAGATSTSGLDNYPEIGDYISFWFKIDKPEEVTDDFRTNNDVFFKLWNNQGGGTVEVEIELRVKSDKTIDDATLIINDTSGGSNEDVIDGFSYSTWYQVKVALHSSDTTVAAIVLTSGGSIKANPSALSATDFTGSVTWSASSTSGVDKSGIFNDYLDHVILKDPFVTPDFIRSPSAPEVYLSETVDFTDKSTSVDGTIDMWDWDFDDGNTSTNENPSHSWSSIGDYTVELVAQDDLGFRNKRKQTLTIVELLEDFEDQDISNYTGSPQNYSVTTNASNQRTYGLESSTNGNSGEIVDTGITTEQGDNIKADLRVENEDGVAHFLFGVQDESNFYTVHIDHEQSEAVFQRVETNTADPVIDSTSFGFATGDWWTVKIQWGGSGSFTIDILDDSESSEASLSGTDTGFTSGGIGWRSDTELCFFDFARIVK